MFSSNLNVTTKITYDKTETPPVLKSIILCEKFTKIITGQFRILVIIVDFVFVHNQRLPLTFRCTNQQSLPII